MYYIIKTLFYNTCFTVIRSLEHENLERCQQVQYTLMMQYSRIRCVAWRLSDKLHQKWSVYWDSVSSYSEFAESES